MDEKQIPQTLGEYSKAMHAPFFQSSEGSPQPPVHVRFRGPSDVLSTFLYMEEAVSASEEQGHTVDMWLVSPASGQSDPRVFIFRRWQTEYLPMPVLLWTGSSQISNSFLILPCQSHHCGWKAEHFRICTKATVTDT